MKKRVSVWSGIFILLINFICSSVLVYGNSYDIIAPEDRIENITNDSDNSNYDNIIELASNTTLASLQAKFPHGKYWNHVGGSNNPDSCTSTPCTHHKTSGCGYYPNSCLCNSFSNAIQCFGFAYKVAYDYYGSIPRDWSTSYNINAVKAGDVIRYKNDTHSIWVTSVNGNTITYADCNSDGRCVIRWNQTISKSSVSSTFNYIKVAPYELENNPEPVPVNVDNDIYMVGDTISLNTNVTNPSSYYLEISRNDAVTWTENLSNSFSFTPNDIGRYTMRLVSLSNPSITSNWIEFNVCVGNRSVGGDFNGDGKDDYATLFDYGNNTAQWHTFLSTGSSFSEEIWRTDSEYYVSCAGGKLTSGDFNGDGLDDVAVIYKYTAHNTSIHVFLSTGNSFKSWQTWFSDTTGYPSDPVIDKVVAGDFNGDTLDDIAVMYEYSKYHAEIHVFQSTGNSFNGWKTWFADSSSYQANLVTGRLAAGDFNGDGLDDIAAMYEYSKYHTEIHVFQSTGSSFNGWKSWFSDLSSYEASLTSGRFAAGDFNGDGLDDIAVMYKYDNFKHSIHVFISEKTKFSGWISWINETEFEPRAVTGRFVSGDFDADGIDDIATMYDYNNSYITFHMYISNKTKFNHAWWNQINDYNAARTTGFKNGNYTNNFTFTHKHTYKNIVIAPTCTDRGYTTHKCTMGDYSYDDAFINALGHVWGDWYISKDPLPGIEGENTRKCQVCKVEEHKSIPALATPTPTAAPKPTAKPTATPKPTPTSTPKPTPTLKPTAVPTAKPTAKPTAAPKPTLPPTKRPAPTLAPAEKPVYDWEINNYQSGVVTITAPRSEKAVLYIAKYRGDMLTESEVIELAALAGVNNVHTAKALEPESGESLKIMLWSEDLEPLAEPIYK